MAERCAIVGGGLVGLTAYATLRHGGLAVGDVAVFSDASDPAAAWRARAAAIRQRRMRSESDGHVAPRSFPGLAVREARRRRSAAPLVESLFDRFRPPVESFLEHVDEVRARSRFDDSVVAGRVARVRAVAGGFELDGRGPFQHVLLAPGHPGLSMPAEWAGDPRAVHAYLPHDYGRRTAVVGAGMAAATEWLNALAAGGDVISVRRRDPERRPLNLPRPLFSRRGLAAFHATSAPERIGLLTRLGAPSYPPGPEWDEPIDAAVREGRFRVAADPRDADVVICATGFRRGFAADPLLADLVEAHDLPTAGRWIVLQPDCTVGALSQGARTLALAGVPAQWAFPAADTLAGAKYAARRFLRRVMQCPTR